jgi:hypothetical protein
MVSATGCARAIVTDKNTLQRERYERNRHAKKQKVDSGSSGASPGTARRKATRISRTAGRDQAQKRVATGRSQVVSEGEPRRDDVDRSCKTSESYSEATNTTTETTTPGSVQNGPESGCVLP